MRLTATAAHSPEEISRLADILRDLWNETHGFAGMAVA